MAKVRKWFRGALSHQPDKDLVDSVLAEVERRIRTMKPAPQSTTDFAGGQRRALRMVRDMKEQVRW